MDQFDDRISLTRGNLMKMDQLLVVLIVAALIYFVMREFFNAYDQVEFTYDPSTGRQSLKGTKSPRLEEPRNLILEGE